VGSIVNATLLSTKGSESLRLGFLMHGVETAEPVKSHGYGGLRDLNTEEHLSLIAGSNWTRPAGRLRPSQDSFLPVQTNLGPQSWQL
jgi:hypothetical protein